MGSGGVTPHGVFDKMCIEQDVEMMIANAAKTLNEIHIDLTVPTP